MAAPSAVFIVGCPRSGTSIFFKTLAGHPDFAFTTNLTRRFAPRYGLVRVAERFGAQHRPVEAGRLWRRFRPRGRRELRADELTEQDRRDLSRLVQDHRRHFGRPIFLSKWPGHSLRIPWTAAGLPDARFIHVVRDGRAVANSILRECKKAGRHWSYMGKEAWPELEAMGWPEYSGALWSRVSTTCAAALERLPPERVHSLRYEDFVADPRRSLDAVAAFCGIEFSEQQHASIPTLHDRNLRWRDEMTPDEQRAMLLGAADGLTAWGYAGSPASEPLAESGDARVEGSGAPGRPPGA
ncbi:MAG: hypothetical protein DRQ55_17420 [Planctomycetota bacterium]|nr:MAG: hypothetical protein DRQ55_17420 [Planctomycetota bacterium]